MFIELFVGAIVRILIEISLYKVDQFYNKIDNLSEILHRTTSFFSQDLTTFLWYHNSLAGASIFLIVIFNLIIKTKL